MKINPILGAGLAITFFGMALALPELSSDLIFDFTEVSEVPLNLLRLGLIIVGFYFLESGLDERDRR